MDQSLGRLPAHQRLDAHDRAVRQRNLRLVVQDELLALDRLPQLVFERKPFSESLRHPLRVEDELVAAGLRFLERRFRVPEQGLGIGAIVRVDRDSDLMATLSSVLPTRNGSPSIFANPSSMMRAILSSLRTSGTMTANRSAPTCATRFELPASFTSPRGHLGQQQVAFLPPDHVVDGLEPLDVEQSQERVSPLPSSTAAAWDSRSMRSTRFARPVSGS
jgi:hypothetical protein